MLIKVALVVNLKEWIHRSRVDTKEILEKKSLEKMETGAGFMCALCACVVEGQVIRSSPVEGKCNVKVLVVVTHLVPWTVAHQAPLSTELSRQEYWSGLPCPSPGDLPNLGIGGLDGKASLYNAGDLGSIPGSGRFPGEGNSNPLQYSCLENPMDGGAWSMGSQRVRHD